MSATNKCPRCGKAVYFAERALGPGGRHWHKACFRCKACGKGVDSTTCKEHQGEIYCSACYGKNFGPHGFGYAGGGAMMHTQGAAAPSSSSQQQLRCVQCKEALDKPTKFCPHCGAQQ